MVSPETDDEIPQPWSVGVLDENQIRGQSTAKWIKEGLLCDVATRPTDLLTKFDRTCIVVCIRDTDNGHGDLVRDIWDISPHTQILILLGRDAFTGLDRECDDTLQEPYSKNDLQQTVQRLFGRGLYNLKTRQYYQLTSYLTGQEETADETTEEPIEEIREQCARIEADIDEITSTFEQTDFEGILLSHRQREKALGNPSMEAEEETRSKYRPSNCPDCGLTWGASHGGRLGRGCERIAALVWQCRGCREILHASPREYDKIL